jgi:hypothetical protein
MGAEPLESIRWGLTAPSGPKTRLRTDRPWRLLVLPAGLVLAAVAAILLLSPRRDAADDFPPDEELPLPGMLSVPSLSLGAEEVVPCTGTGTGDFRYQFVCGPNGDRWLFTANTGRPPMYARRRADGWPAFQPLCDTTWRNVTNLRATLDAASRPVVVWTGISLAASQELLAAARWTGDRWTPVEVLDRYPGFDTTLDVATDARGRVHVVYTRQFDPPETYSVGWIVPDSASADKCFHVVHDGTRWTTPAPTGGPAPCSLGRPRLSIGPADALYASVVVQPIARSGLGKPYLAYQKWDGRSWTPLRRVTPQRYTVSTGILCVDAWGTKHAWWTGPQISTPCQYWQVRSGRPSRPGFLLFVRLPFVAANPRGEVLTADDNRQVSLWNGRVWTGPLNGPEADQVALSPDGRAFCTVARADCLRIREINVEKGDIPHFGDSATKNAGNRVLDPANEGQNRN